MAAAAAAAAASLDVKIVLLGEGRVGKTSVLLRYVQNVFSDAQSRPCRPPSSRRS